jgi:hypothetical protein
MSRRALWSPSVGGGAGRLLGHGFRPSSLFIIFVTFGIMVTGILAFVGYYYVAGQPILGDYFWNLMAVSAVSAVIGVIVAYGIATLGLYSKGLMKYGK